MTNDITNDLALLDDWLAGKGYGEEAGLCMRAMDLIRKQADEIEKLRAENKALTEQSWVIDGALLSEREEIEKLRTAHDKLRAKLHAATGELCDRAARAALGDQQ